MPQIIANAGIPMLFLHLPAMLLALLPVVIVEWIVAYRQLAMAKKRALKGVIAANCFSTLLGFPLFWLVGVLLLVVAGPFLDDVIPEASTIVRPIFESGTGAIWLRPDASISRIMGAGLAMLVPAFFVSVYSERWILRVMWKDVPSSALSRYVWLAHSLSYPALVAIWLQYVTQLW